MKESVPLLYSCGFPAGLSKVFVRATPEVEGRLRPDFQSHPALVPKSRE